MDFEQYQNLSVGVELVGEWIWAVWVPKTVPRPSKGRWSPWGPRFLQPGEQDSFLYHWWAPVLVFGPLSMPHVAPEQTVPHFCCILRALWEGGIDHNGHQKC